MADWVEHGLPVERGSATTAPRASAPRRRIHASMSAWRSDWWGRAVDLLASCSIGQLLGLWLGVVVGCGILYWIASVQTGHGLRVGADAVDGTLGGLVSAIYFSFVTALSIGYGDVVPVGAVRIVAVAEGAAGLLIFGCVISKLVSQRQEALIAEIHRITFEGRLDRVRTNLHLVLSEFQAIARVCAAPDARREQVLNRLDSATTVFAGELQTIHDLLYRPQQVPEEQALQSILASLAGSFRELIDLLACLNDDTPRSASLQASLRAIAALAAEICGECVPRAYAADLRDWMDRIQELARQLT